MANTVPTITTATDTPIIINRGLIFLGCFLLVGIVGADNSAGSCGTEVGASDPILGLSSFSISFSGGASFDILCFFIDFLLDFFLVFLTFEFLSLADRF